MNERDTRIELAFPPWEGDVLPLYKSRLKYWRVPTELPLLVPRIIILGFVDCEQ